MVLDKVDVPIWLEDKLYIDFSDEKDFQINFERLLFGLDIEKYFEVKENTLELLDFHAAIVKEDYCVTLASSLSSEDDYIFRNPDGAKSPLKDLYIIRASTSGLESLRFTHIRLGHSCIFESEKYYIVFANSKPRQGTYDMCGYKWFLRKTDLGVQAVEGIFENENWGWFPTIDDTLNINHFSFDGYFRCFNNEKTERIEPHVMEQEHISFLAKISSSEIPNSSSHISNLIRKYLIYEK